uniref:SH2 domain-containing protein n=1 Tax=Tetranychus urticae TaxID=32264 RepID=T1K4U8_TETUR
MFSNKLDKDASKALLEWELSLDSSDLRSHAWYHGNIERDTAESLVIDEGSFLVRDSSTKQGEYVLTCRWNGSIFHFVINRQVLPPFAVGFPDRIQYSFEDEPFDTVSGLITFSVCNRKPISLSSGALISIPVARTVPLSNDSQGTQSIDQPMEDQLTMSTIAQLSSLTLDSRLPIRSDSRSSIESLNRYQKPIMRSIPGSGSITPSVMTYSDRLNQPSLQNGPTISQEREISKNEPVYANAEVYQDYMRKRESEDFAYFSDYSDSRSAGSKEDYSSYIISANYSSSRINPINFHTYLLPKNNKPLDGSAMNKIRSTLLDTGARLLANHVTQSDLEFIYHVEDSCDLGMGVKSGLELLILPQGDKYRQDFLDRIKCFQYFIATSVLTCQSERERAAILDKWIQIGFECKTGLGNLMTFAIIMRTLLLPMIVRLKRTWLALRQLHTQSAVTFESKMKPVLKGMNECKEPIAPNTTFPYIWPSVEIIHRYSSLLKSGEPNSIDSLDAFKNLSLDLEVEKIGTDYGLETIYFHLDYCRQIVSQCSLFKRNRKILYEDVVLEDLLVDMFRTEFHRRFLWGTKGSNVDATQRYDKFDQLLNLLSQKCEFD